MSEELREAIAALIDAAYNAMAEMDHYAMGEVVAAELEDACERVRELL